jgi:hypothetical protein
MTRRHRNILGVRHLLMTLASTLPATAAGLSVPTSSPITVRVLDLAQVGSHTLDHAKAVTEEVFRPMGITINWMRCSGKATRQDLACQAPAGPNDMSLRIFRRGKATQKSTRHATSGITLSLVPEGGKGIIYLYFDRVLEVQNSQRIPIKLVLGIIIAHEMGHLMLPGERHALAGIMRGNLEPKDWQMAAQSQLGFTDQQKEIIAAGVQARSAKPNGETSKRQITSHWLSGEAPDFAPLFEQQVWSAQSARAGHSNRSGAGRPAGSVQLASGKPLRSGFDHKNRSVD